MAREADGASIGARLRAARERKGLTVLQAAEKLHLDARILEGLEADDFTPLGAGVYVRGHLRRYAELVGESAAQLQELYASATPATHPDLTRIPRGEPSPESSRLLLPGLLAVVGLALAGIVWWLLTLPGARPHALTPAPPAETSADTTEDPQAAIGAAATAPEPGAPAGTALPGQTQLGLRFSEASWVQVWDARGRAILDGLVPAGTSRTVSGTAPLRVVLGNAPGVAVEVNGRPLALDGLVRRRGDAHVTVDALGHASAAPRGE